MFFKSDDVRDWQDLNYDYAITKDPSEIESKIFDLYGKRTKAIYEKCDKEDYILSIRYNR